ncbi:MAG TPA: primase-like DNA-binding domain-containing protein, partial [Bryobacteraceae bacterium]|nr:primase-like DNA-binding domain-containing protein [Bryobacteraceae bacterium]
IALMNELSGVLNWLLEGCLRWQAEGLPVTESVVRATGQYRAESDQVARFLEDRCLIGEYFSATSRQLYIAYKAWAQETGERESEVLSETAFGLRLGIRFKGKKKPHGKIYEGVALRSESQCPS